MRSLSRDRQSVWFAKITENIVGTSTVPVYEKPRELHLVVTATAGTPQEIGAGVVPDYDREIIYHKARGCCNSFDPVEGMAVWVDRKPKLDAKGNLAKREDGKGVITPPDYRLKRIITTQKSNVARYGIERIGGNM